MQLTYRELQSALNLFPSCKIKRNASYKALAAEYSRLTGESVTKPTSPEVRVIPQFTYREIQAKLREYRHQKLTNIKLNSKREVLEQELARIEAGPPAGKSRVHYLPLVSEEEPLSLSMIQHARYSI